jgi:hypothetical protein
MNTFPVTVSEVPVPSNKPVFSLDAVTRSALSIEPIDIGDNTPIMQFTHTVKAPETITIPLHSAAVIPRRNVVTQTTYRSANTVSNPGTPNSYTVKIPNPTPAQIADSVALIMSDLVKLSRKQYNPNELFAKYPDTITGSRSEFFTRTQNKAFIGIAWLNPKNGADVKLIMEQEGLATPELLVRAKNIR